MIIDVTYARDRRQIDVKVNGSDTANVDLNFISLGERLQDIGQAYLCLLESLVRICTLGSVQLHLEYNYLMRRLNK